MWPCCVNYNICSCIKIREDCFHRAPQWKGGKSLFSVVRGDGDTTSMNYYIRDTRPHAQSSLAHEFAPHDRLGHTLLCHSLMSQGKKPWRQMAKTPSPCTWDHIAFMSLTMWIPICLQAKNPSPNRYSTSYHIPNGYVWARALPYTDDLTT